MKKEKTRSHVVRNTFLYSMLVVGMILTALVSPWKELQTSLIDSANTSQEDILSALQTINLTLQQTNLDTYVLARELPGTTTFSVAQNTCHNGVKVMVQLKNPKQSETGSVLLSGIALRQGLSAYSTTVVVNDTTPVQVRYLPSSMFLENDTAFLDYKITQGSYSENVKYSVECY